jgi:hypothetical protein
VRLITDREAQALREDSLGEIANIATRRLPDKRVWGPHRVRIRIGDEPFRDIKRRLAVSVVYRKRPPTCRACGRRLQHGDKAIQFMLRGSFSWNHTHALMHEVCPVDHVYEPVEGTNMVVMDRETHRRLHAGEDPHRR